jgi:hypothetical protein
MISYKTFTRKTGISQESIKEDQESVRMEAEAFIRSELKDEQVVNISEAAVIIPLGMSGTFVSTTVWYKS